MGNLCTFDGVRSERHIEPMNDFRWEIDGVFRVDEVNEWLSDEEVFGEAENIGDGRRHVKDSAVLNTDGHAEASLRRKDQDMKL